jgi:hypothetical protein
MGDEFAWGASIMINICFIVEGLSEEKFIEHVIVPHLEKLKNINSKVINLDGGIAKKRIEQLIIGMSYTYDYVTTMIDFCRLHAAKFDNYSEIMRMDISSGEKASKLEEQLLSKFEVSQKLRIIPHIQPYEFEALCFADSNGLIKSDMLLEKHQKRIEIEKNKYLDCESINNQELPAKRLEKYGYSKLSSLFYLHANLALIRESCPHFNQWIIKLENTVKTYDR